MAKELRIRLDKDVEPRLEAFRLASRRSLTSAVNLLISEALDAREAMGTKPASDVGTARPATSSDIHYR